MSKIDQEVRELKQRVAQLERQMAFVLKQQNLEYQDARYQAAPLEVLQLMRQGKKIQAIKAYREASGVGLKEAKEYVEALDL